MPLPLDELVSHPELVNPRAQQLDWEELLFEYELALDDIQAWLRGLNEEQVHFKPAERVFSIAEIVTHSSFNDELCWSWIALLVQGRGAEIDPKALISGVGARNVATLLDLNALNEACRTLARLTIDSLPGTPNLTATAPHPHFGALNAKGWIYFMALHRGRHRSQCESVIDAPGFPRSMSRQTQPREAYQPSERKTWLRQDAGSHPTEAVPGQRKVRGKRSGARSKKHSAKAGADKRQPATKRQSATKRRSANKKRTSARSK